MIISNVKISKKKKNMRACKETKRHSTYKKNTYISIVTVPEESQALLIRQQF